MNIRTGTIDDLQTIAEIEARSFPPAEAASSKVLKERLLRFPEHFWIMEETKRGDIGFRLRHGYG